MNHKKNNVSEIDIEGDIMIDDEGYDQNDMDREDEGLDDNDDDGNYRED